MYLNTSKSYVVLLEETRRNWMGG